MFLFRIVYCSRGTGPQTHKTLTALLAVARERNERDGVTGLLCYSRPYFLQCLEGPRAVVERTMERIYKDPRHTDVVLLGAEPAVDQGFPDCGMKLVTPDQIPPGPGRDFLAWCEGPDFLPDPLDPTVLFGVMRELAAATPA